MNSCVFFSVRRDEARLVYEAGELAERAGDVLYTQRPRQDARREQNRQGWSVRYSSETPVSHTNDSIKHSGLCC